MSAQTINGICGLVAINSLMAMAGGIFGQTALGGMGGVSLPVQILGTLLGITIAVLGSILVYGTIHKISSTNED